MKHKRACLINPKALRKGANETGKTHTHTPLFLVHALLISRTVLLGRYGWTHFPTDFLETPLAVPATGGSFGQDPFYGC